MNEKWWKEGGKRSKGEGRGGQRKRVPRHF